MYDKKLIGAANIVAHSIAKGDTDAAISDLLVQRKTKSKEVAAIMGMAIKGCINKGVDQFKIDSFILKLWDQI